jgi:hypothetical protein
MFAPTAGAVLHKPARPNDVLYNQYSRPGFSTISSQNFEPAYDAYDAQAADDFIVPASQIWTVNMVEVAGAYLGGPADSVNVFFYADIGTLPGTPVFTETNLIPVSGLDTGDFAIQLSPPAVLPAGTYWVSVQANQNLDPDGQWFWRTRVSSANNYSAWRNPGGGFQNFYCNDDIWRHRAQECGISWDAPDQIFRLSGTALGAPTPTGTPPTSTSTPSPSSTGTPPTATGTRTPRPTVTGTHSIPSPVETYPAPFTPLPTTPPTATPACGPAWRGVSTPNQGPTYNSLSSISALSASDIWAAGTYIDEYGQYHTLTERWNGSVWSVVPSPDVTNYDTFLRGVSAISTNDVWAVGGYRDLVSSVTSTFIIHWNGSSWSIVPSPNPGSISTYLVGVSARAANDAWAVGDYFDGITTYNLILHWDGTGWTQATTPNPGVNYQTLYSVTSVSATDAWAVGSYYGPFGSLTQTLHWDGSAWTVVGSPNLGEDINLLGVDAISATEAWAVGWYYDGSTEHTLTIRWNGSSWSIVFSPDVVDGQDNYLTSVTMISPNDIWAVGNYWDLDGNIKTFSEHWDGTQWSLVTTLSPGDSYDFLYGVVGVSPDNAWSVGSTSFNGVTNVLMERYNDPCAPVPTGTSTSTATPTSSNTPTTTPTSTITSTPSAIATSTRTLTLTPTPCTITFSDVPSTDVFYPFIRCLACRGIISGYADGTFRPGNDVTRGQLSKIVSNSAGFQETIPPTQQTFTDVPNSNPFWVWIERMVLHNVIGGYPCGGPLEPCDDQNRPYFRWGANATRGQISKIVSEAKGFSDVVPPAQQTFTDVSNTNPFWVWIERLAERGIMSGYPCGGSLEPCDDQNHPYFRWYNNATRGQTAKIVANTFFPGCVTPAKP